VPHVRGKVESFQQARAEVPEPERKKSRNETYKRLFQFAELQLERHVSLVLDATFSRREHRDELRRLLNAKSANYCFIEAEAPDEVFKQHLSKEKERVTSFLTHAWKISKC
jgi:predicted kinase